MSPILLQALISSFLILFANERINFDAIIAPEHDSLVGDNVYSSKGAIHYITESEINNAKPYLMDKVKNQKIVALILGGPNKYYSFDKDQLTNKNMRFFVSEIIREKIIH